MDREAPYETGSKRVILKESNENYASVCNFLKDRYVKWISSLTEFDEGDINYRGLAFPVLFLYHLPVRGRDKIKIKIKSKMKLLHCVEQKTKQNCQF